MPSDATTSWDALRDSMPIANRWAYFDHAAVAPLPAPAAQTLSEWCQQALHDGDTAWPDWNRQVQTTRRTAAAMVGADPRLVALVPSTTAGVSLVAEGFPWKPGDNMVTLENEFPTNLYPWMNLESKGVETRRVPFRRHGDPIDDVLAACDDHTRIVSLSWVGYASGYRLNVAKAVEAVHARGAYFMLDAIQGLGVFPLHVGDIPIDFLAADGHKWMLGPEGAGIFYLRGEHLDLLRPTGVGWNSVAHCFDFGKIDLAFKDSAARFEGGSLNMAGFLALGSSLELLQRCGLTPHASPIAERISQLTTHACDQLRAIGAEIMSSRDNDTWSGIVSFQLGNQDLMAARKRCLEAGVVLSLRDGCLRISPHAYNNEEEVDQLIDALRG